MNPSVSVVLVNTLYPRNIGYTARVSANMGASRLILVGPQCEADFEARQAAAGAQMMLLEAKTYADWNEFYQEEPEGLRIAFCARQKKESDDLSLEDRLLDIKKRGISGPIYLIFGPEDRGLSNDDVRLAHFICSLPVYGKFTSMNLSHAAMLALYLTRRHLGDGSHESSPASTDTTFESARFPEASLEEWLNVLGFQTGDRRTDAYKVLKRLLLSNVPSAKELRILEAVIHQTIRKLKD